MTNLKKVLRFFRILLFAMMFAVCMILGIAPILPKRKEEIAVEIKMEATERQETNTSNAELPKQ